MASPSQPPLNPQGQGRWGLAWRPTSEDHLARAEKHVLKVLQSSYEELHVPVGPNAYIHTIVFESEQAPSVDEEPRLPLVMIHGFGCGIPQFYKNFDHLHSNRRLYAIDLPGFARSTRVNFTPDAEKCEQEFVNYVEKWREGVGLEKFILLGHCFGGFISCWYTIEHPDRVRHLILDDPWGFAPNKDSRERSTSMSSRVVSFFKSKFNPLTPVRIAGPLGPSLINYFRPDLAASYGREFIDYVYHSNAQSPTGETAFFYLQQPPGAESEMIIGISTELGLQASIPISFIYGTNSWINSSVIEQVRNSRYLSDHFEAYRIPNAGHHVHADQPKAFNDTVNTILKIVDEDNDEPEHMQHQLHADKLKAFNDEDNTILKLVDDGR